MKTLLFILCFVLATSAIANNCHSKPGERIEENLLQLAEQVVEDASISIADSYSPTFNNKAVCVELVNSSDKDVRGVLILKTRRAYKEIQFYVNAKNDSNNELYCYEFDANEIPNFIQDIMHIRFVDLDGREHAKKTLRYNTSPTK